LTQKNTQRIEEYGPRLKERFAGFMSLYGTDVSAQSFIREVKVKASLG
jgi:hypothetical protein